MRPDAANGGSWAEAVTVGPLVTRDGDNCRFCGAHFFPPHVSRKRHGHERSCTLNPERKVWGPHVRKASPEDQERRLCPICGCVHPAGPCP